MIIDLAKAQKDIVINNHDLKVVAIESKTTMTVK